MRELDELLDPVCGMRVGAEQTTLRFTYIGQTYAFCSRECYERFARSPEHFIALEAHEPQGHCGYLCPGQRQAAEHPRRTIQHDSAIESP